MNTFIGPLLVSSNQYYNNLLILGITSIRNIAIIGDISKYNKTNALVSFDNITCIKELIANNSWPGYAAWASTSIKPITDYIIKLHFVVFNNIRDIRNMIINLSNCTNYTRTDDFWANAIYVCVNDPNLVTNSTFTNLSNDTELNNAVNILIGYGFNINIINVSPETTTENQLHFYRGSS